MIKRNSAIKFGVIAVALVLIGLVFVFKRPSTTTIASPQQQAPLNETRWSNEPIRPIPTEMSLDAAKVALGEKLFNEPRLSHDNTVSCASCHSMTLGGTDQKTHSIGINGQEGGINAPTVFNSAYNFKQFWDGRADTLEDQVNGPTHAAGEMGSTWEEIVGKLSQSPDYVSAFTQVYHGGVTDENIRNAIAEFERSLTTPSSSFDRFLQGDQNALTAEEKEGYRVFKSVGCVSCHQGVNVGGNLFQEFGVMGDYFKDRGNITAADLGRFNVTHRESDKHVFKVPSLRNISQTYPYFHDGSAKSLEDAVAVMSKYQLGRQLSSDEIHSIVKFLKSLDGVYTRYGTK